MADKEVFYATGRRKTSVARVYMTKGKGVFTVNKKPMDEYFGRETSSMIINQPLDVVEMHNKFDFNIMVKGGGDCLLYTSPSPRDLSTSRMPSSA